VVGLNHCYIGPGWNGIKTKKRDPVGVKAKHCGADAEEIEDNSHPSHIFYGEAASIKDNRIARGRHRQHECMAGRQCDSKG